MINNPIQAIYGWPGKGNPHFQPEQTVLDVEGLNKGVYTLQLLTEKGSVARKISLLR